MRTTPKFLKGIVLWPKEQGACFDPGESATIGSTLAEGGEAGVAIFYL